MDYLIKNELLAKEQHGFMKGKNCTTNLLEYLDILTDAINKGIPINALYTDFKNAFDSVSLKKLCLKLRQIGIQGQLLRWIESFLSNRKQRKVMGNSKTEWVDVVSGVVQGSVLGPIIFLLFINDLPSKLINECRLYADDNKIIAPVSFVSDQQAFQNDIKRLDE
jgi:ribonucleases P/MRP protein subunit RPP40